MRYSVSFAQENKQMWKMPLKLKGSVDKYMKVEVIQCRIQKSMM